MATRGPGNVGLWLLLCFLTGSSEYVSPPKNIKFGMNGMFCLQWQWESPENKLNCLLRYAKTIVQHNSNMSSEKGKMSHYEARVKMYDLNSEINFEVQAECNRSNIIYYSKPEQQTIQLAPGNPETSVNNLSCVWQFMEYVNCTWEPGLEQPPNVNYTLRYWVTDEEPCKLAKHTEQFSELLDTGKHCENYTHRNGIAVGCQFGLHSSLHPFKELLIVVTDRSKDVKPFISYIYLNNIAKPRPPTINSVHRTANQTIYVSWNALVADSLYHVQLQSLKDESKQDFTDFLGLSKEIPNMLPDITYTVKVRVRLPWEASSPSDQYLWSDWSEMKTLPGKDEGQTTSLILLFLVPVIILAAAVTLLIYLRRLQIFIFPRIPDPGKVLSNDLQQWLKNGRTVCNEPRKEEICHVSLLESPLCSHGVE